MFLYFARSKQAVRSSCYAKHERIYNYAVHTTLLYGVYTVGSWELDLSGTLVYHNTGCGQNSIAQREILFQHWHYLSPISVVCSAGACVRARIALSVYARAGGWVGRRPWASGIYTWQKRSVITLSYNARILTAMQSLVSTYKLCGLSSRGCFRIDF